MRLVTFERENNEKRIGAVDAGGSIVDLTLAYEIYLREVEGESAASRLADARVPADMRGLFEGGEASLRAAKTAFHHALKTPDRVKAPSGETLIHRPGAVRLRAGLGGCSWLSSG